ncbi:MAG: hypothetical protein JRJ12_17480 [Deltaproteobacteria bacterium]|nr:hypothetical protein [Deltaproteobacteria bacterium]
MNSDEIRKIVREEIRAALSDFFSEKRLSEKEEDIQRERDAAPWPLPMRFDYQVDRLSLYIDRLAFLSMKLEDWGSECECKYSASDIQHIKDTIDNL